MKWLNGTVNNLLLLPHYRDKAEKREEAERKGPRGEEHPAALEDLR